MKNKFYFLAGLLFFIFATGCDDTYTPPGAYTNGVFVINEGAFGSSNSELSFINADNSVNNNLYGNNNSSAILGDVFQSMTIASGSAYLVINNSNKVVVVDLDNLQNQTTITGFIQPRYMVTYGGKGYISEWFSFGNNGYLKIIDLSTNNIVDSVEVGKQPDQIMVVGDNILTANSGDTTLHLVNTTTLAKTNIGNVDYPKYITKTNDGNIWVLYTGIPPWEAGGPTDGGLLVLNSTATTVVKNITIGSTISNPTQLTTDGNNLYYEYQSSVYKIDKAATVAPASPFITTPCMYLYGLNYYAASNTLYVADAKNFSTSGVARRYNATTGAVIDTLNVGIAPNGFLFN